MAGSRPQHLCSLTVPCSKRDYGAQFGTEAQHERHHRSTWRVVQVADRGCPRPGGCGPRKARCRMIALVFEVYGEFCFLSLIAFLVLASGGPAIPTGYRLAKTCWRTLAPPSQRSRAYSQARRACDPSPPCRAQAPPAAARSRRSQAPVRPHRRGSWP
jgi:hypothetical protein